MKPLDVKSVKKKIRTLIHHLGSLQGSYPQVLEDPEYARAHLLVLRKVLPHLTHVLRFAADMVLLSERITDLVGKGSEDLGNVADNLRNINRTAESAVQEILTGLEQLEEKLQAVQKAAAAGEEVEAAVEEASMQLTGIFTALQFQDITSQKIEATNALLADLADGLNSLVEQLGMPVEGTEIEVRAGTFDEHAEYDPESAREKQREIDALLEGGEERSEGSRDEAVSQDDIDALMEKEE